MNYNKTNTYLLYAVAFLLLFSLGLFKYYDQQHLSKMFLYHQNYSLFYVCKIVVPYILSISSIFICNKIEREDHSSQLIFPMSLIGIMIVMVSLSFMSNFLWLNYWSISYSIITAFCLINIHKKRRH